MVQSTQIKGSRCSILGIVLMGFSRYPMFGYLNYEGRTRFVAGSSVSGLSYLPLCGVSIPAMNASTLMSMGSGLYPLELYPWVRGLWRLLLKRPFGGYQSMFALEWVDLRGTAQEPMIIDFQGTYRHPKMRPTKGFMKAYLELIFGWWSRWGFLRIPCKAAGIERFKALGHHVSCCLM